jgi:hypothetical protein
MTRRVAQVAEYLGYNAMKNFFPGYSLYPNPQCEDGNCCRNQKAFESWKASGAGAELKGWRVREDAKEEEVNKNDADNEWGITLEDETPAEPAPAAAPASAPASAPAGQLPAGVEFAYAKQNTAPEENRVQAPAYPRPLLPARARRAPAGSCSGRSRCVRRSVPEPEPGTVPNPKPEACSSAAGLSVSTGACTAAESAARLGSR